MEKKKNKYGDGIEEYRKLCIWKKRKRNMETVWKNIGGFLYEIK